MVSSGVNKKIFFYVIQSVKFQPFCQTKFKAFFLFILSLFLFFNKNLQAGTITSYLVRDIKSFGASGDGKTNDHEAFEKAAAFFNARGGNGKLVISKGVYIVGKQVVSKGEKKKQAFKGQDVLHFIKLTNFELKGETGSTLKYEDSLRFGSFDPETGKPFSPATQRFIKGAFAASIGSCIYFENSSNIKIENLEVNGNQDAFIVGGRFGDLGRQLPHYGIFIKNCKDITVDKVYVHHSALDGISLANQFSDSIDEKVLIKNSVFEYNGRQGFSWVGGKGLKVIKCSFNHTGRATIRSAPSAGLDIEAERGYVKDGYFEDCEFINNRGCGLVADTGPSSDCFFKGCTFWGVTNWSIWVTKPGFTFQNCKIYGSVVHAFNALNREDATKFLKCYFEDKPYKDGKVYGKFLVEINNKRRVTFEKCTFVANQKRLCWLSSPVSFTPEEMFQLEDCRFIVKNASYPEGAYVGILRGVRHKNCVLEFQNLEALSKKYRTILQKSSKNVELGGSKIIFKH
jgi:hypothetical protein